MENCIVFTDLYVASNNRKDDKHYIKEVLRKNKDNNLPVRFINCEFQGEEYYYDGTGGLDWFSEFGKKFDGHKIIFDNCILENIDFNKFLKEELKFTNRSDLDHCHFSDNTVEFIDITLSRCWFSNCDLSKSKLSEFVTFNSNGESLALDSCHLNFKNNLVIVADLDNLQSVGNKKFSDYRLGNSEVISDYSLKSLSESGNAYLLEQEDLPKFMEANAKILKNSVKDIVKNYNGNADDFLEITSKNLKNEIKGLENCGFIQYNKDRKARYYYREIGNLSEEIVKTFVKELQKERIIKKNNDGLYVMVEHKRKPKIKSNDNVELQR